MGRPRKSTAATPATPTTETTAAPATPPVVETQVTEQVAPPTTPEVTTPAVAEEQVTSTPVEEVITLPVPKRKAASSASVVTRVEVSPAPLSLATISLADLVQRKHDFNLNAAQGGLSEIIEFLDRYEDKMRAGLEVAADIGESLQKQLYKNYLKIFQLESSKERDVAMEVLLWKFYKDEKGAFKVTQLSRYTRNGKWIIEELNMFLQLNHIFNAVKNPVDRIVRLKQFKLAAIISAFPNDKIRYTENFINWATAIH